MTGGGGRFIVIAAEVPAAAQLTQRDEVAGPVVECPFGWTDSTTEPEDYSDSQ